MGDKQDQVQEHSELVEHLKKTYVDADGTRPTTIAICEAECKSRDLKCKIVDEKVAAMALRNGDRVVMVSFGIDIYSEKELVQPPKEASDVAKSTKASDF